MKIYIQLLWLLSLFAGPIALAFPPAPYHTYFGTIRDSHGTPLGYGDGPIIFSSEVGNSTVDVAHTFADTTLGAGINYALHVPMDAGTTAAPYNFGAMNPELPFTIRAVLDGVTYLPIEIEALAGTNGVPADSTRLDITLGIDSDGDGLPDAWEQSLIDTDSTGQLQSLADVNPGDDLDEDGLTNLQEFKLGSFALDAEDGLFIKIGAVRNGVVDLWFLGFEGRIYQFYSSDDLKTWSGPVAFTLDESEAQTAAPLLRSSLRAEFDGITHVYVPAPDITNRFFRIHAE